MKGARQSFCVRQRGLLGFPERARVVLGVPYWQESLGAEIEKKLQRRGKKRGSLGEYVPAYLKLKHQEWNDFSRHLTQWERETTLDC